MPSAIGLERRAPWRTLVRESEMVPLFNAVSRRELLRIGGLSLLGLTSARLERLQAQTPAARENLINNFEARLLLPPIIHRRYIREKVIVELLVFFENAKTFAQAGPVQDQYIVPLRLHDLPKLGAKQLLDAGKMRTCFRHGINPSPARLFSTHRRSLR